MRFGPGSLAALGVLAARLALAAPAAAAPLEAYGRLPFVEQIALSPNGHMLAYVITDGDKRFAVIKDLDTGRIVSGIKAGETKVRAIQWAGSNHLIITVSVTGYIVDVETPRGEWSMAIDYNLARKRQLGLMSNIYDDAHQTDTLNVIDGAPDIRMIGGHPYAFVQGTVFVDSKGRTGLFKIDLDDNDRGVIVSQGFENTQGYAVDARGKAVAEEEYDAQKSRWTLKINRDGGWKEVNRATAAIEHPALMGLGRDGASIAVAFNTDKGSVLRELSPDGTTWGDPVPSPDALIWDAATYRMIGKYDLDGDEAKYEFFDPADEAAWKSVVRAYPGSTVSLSSISDNHRRMILRVDSPADGPSYALLDLDTRHADWIADEYVGLKGEDIAARQAIAFKARDGLALTGYLTLPNGRPGKALPLVVLPHGGPADRDDPGFDWWAQAIASRGYAVLQVNYRGSDGFGWDLLSAGFGQWGKLMQTDLSDGVRYLARQGTIDPARVCIFGGSYGGYAALAGATLDPGVYRCAVSVAGPADLRRFVADWKESEGDQGVGSQRYWLRYMGPQAGLDAISPARLADKAAVPILLIHGRDDTVVPYVQSQLMAEALRKAGRSVELVTLQKEDHWLSRGETRLLMLQSAMAFIEKNNPPQ